MNISETVAVLVIICGLLIGFQPASVQAQANMDNGGNFGIGLLLGEPTGVSIKSWNSELTAFNLGAAWSLAERNEALHLHADFLWHSWFSNTENLAFYYGIGGRIIFAGNPTAGVRVPLGLNYVFESIPFDLFVEAVPIMDFSPATELAGNGAVGIRFYF